MNQQNGRMGLVLAVLGAVVLVAIGFMLLIKPQMDAAATANEDRQLTVQDNEMLQTRLESLKKQASQVKEWEKDLDAIASQIPGLPEPDELERLLFATGNEAGVAHVESRLEAVVAIDGTTLTSATESVKGTEDAGAEPPAPEDTATAGEGTATDVPVEVVAPVEGPVVQGLVAVQFSVVVEGTPGAVVRYINLLHTQEQRYITLSGFAIQRSEGAAAAPGRPELSIGDWSATVNGLAFVIIDQTSPVEADELDGVAPYTGSFRNPFQPVTP